MKTRQEYHEEEKRYNKNFRSQRSRIWAKEASRFLASKQWKIAKAFIFEHFDKKCTNCGSDENVQLDHIYPRVKDNKAKRWLDITNLQPLCGDCNSKVKGTKSTDYRSYADKLVWNVRRSDDVYVLRQSSISVLLIQPKKL